MNRVFLILAGGLFSIIGLTADQYAFSIDRRVTNLESEIRNSLELNDMFSRLQGQVLFADALYSLSYSWTEGDSFLEAIKEIHTWSFDEFDESSIQDLTYIHSFLEDFSDDKTVSKEKLNEMISQLMQSKDPLVIYDMSYEYSDALTQALNSSKTYIYNIHHEEVEELGQLRFARQTSISIAILMSLLTLIALALYIKFAAGAALSGRSH